MQTGYSEADQESLDELRASLSSFLNRHTPIDAMRAIAEGKPFDVDTWRRLCTDFDLLSLAIPEERGGIGAGFAALSVCAEELGRVLYPGPWIAAGILGARLLALLAPDDLREAQLPALLSGEKIATLALHESLDAPLEHEMGELATTVERSESGLSLTGSKELVPDAGFADLVIVSALNSETQTPGLYLVSMSDDSVERTEYSGADPSRRFGAVRFRHAAAVLLAEGEGVEAEVQRHVDFARLVQAAESVGAATAAIELGLEYAKVREQFGRPIGTFQAVKHKYADLFRDVESARHITRATLAESDNPALGDLRLSVSISAARSSDAFATTAKEIVHLHGGIGYTWEHDAHLFYRRALHNRTAFGHSERHRERIATLIGL